MLTPLTGPRLMPCSISRFDGIQLLRWTECSQTAPVVRVPAPPHLNSRHYGQPQLIPLCRPHSGLCYAGYGVGARRPDVLCPQPDLHRHPPVCCLSDDGTGSETPAETVRVLRPGTPSVLRHSTDDQRHRYSKSSYESVRKDTIHWTANV